MNREEIKRHLESLIANGELDSAVEVIDQYKKIYGYDDEIASMESIINIYNNDYVHALQCIREGLQYNIYNGDLYFLMGKIHEWNQEFDRAYLCYEHALLYTESKEKQNTILEVANKLKAESELSVKGYSIVILTYNNLEYTKLCIDSIRKYNGSEDCQIVIVDNNSTDGTVEWIKEQKDIKYILNKENKGFPAGCNQGIEIANKNNDIFLLNNDTIIMPNSIFNLRMGLYSSEEIGATGAISNSISYYQQIDEQYNDFSGYMNFALKNNVTDESSYEQRVKLIGFAMLIKRNVLDEVGLLDERFTPGNFEDDDISFRILLKGYKLLLCKDSYIHHFGSVSFKKEIKYNEVLKVNSSKFKEKWGFTSEYSTNIRNDLIHLISQDSEKKMNILEIGCACGATLLSIKNNYPNSQLYGIEINENSAKIAKCFADVCDVNIEKSNLPYEEEFFDYIMFGDVLEHLNNPEKVLKNMKKYLKKDGYILASIPNVMHYTVVRDLINGNWTYQDAGILNRTHVRFFTKNEIEKMFNEAGYSGLVINSNDLVMSESDIDFINQLSNISFNNNLEEFMVYQYVLRCKKSVQLDENIIKKCKVLIRRIEFNIDSEETEEEIIANLRDGTFTQEIISEVVARYAIHKVEILNYLAVKLIENSILNDVLTLLNDAYELDRDNLDTNYNLAYVLNMIGESNLALEYLYNLSETNESIDKLKESIEGIIYE